MIELFVFGVVAHANSLVHQSMQAHVFTMLLLLPRMVALSLQEDIDVCIFDIDTRQPIASMKGHSDLVYTVAFSSDGSRIASGGRDNTFYIFGMLKQESRFAISMGIRT